jgi:hypothetical protein
MGCDSSQSGILDPKGSRGRLVVIGRSSLFVGYVYVGMCRVDRA